MAYKDYLKRQRKGVLRNLAPEPAERLVIRYDLAIKYLNKYCLKDIQLLDIGCRDGHFIERLMQDGFENLRGIDLIEDGIRESLSKGLNVSVHDAHNKLPFQKEEFDVVTMLHSLEHCYDPDKVIDSVYRVLKHKGVLYIEVPGKENNVIRNHKDLLNGQQIEFRFNKNELIKMLDDKFDLLDYQIRDDIFMSFVFRKK